jgi:hypothetical protein
LVIGYFGEMIFKKDIPNKDFECNPTGSCWCKEEEYKLPIPNNSELCYSPREIKKIIKKA